MSIFVGCTKCDDCANLYYEPTIRVLFLKAKGKEIDSLKTTIKVFNGDSRALNLRGDSSIVNRKKARYAFPIRMDADETAYSLSYEVFTTRPDTLIRKTTGARDSIVRVPHIKSSSNSFTLKYKRDTIISNDRFLIRAVLKAENVAAGNDTVKVVCTDATSDCYNNTASIYIYINE